MSAAKQHGGSGTRRDFLHLSTAAFGGVAAVGATWPLIDQMNPDKSVLALSTLEVDISQIEEGSQITVVWQGKVVFIRHRTPAEIEEARADDGTGVPEANDEDRVKPGQDQWLVVIGICTHLGCIPIAYEGLYKGYFCPCHGSHYDVSGRLRKGPAERNLDVPPYQFLDDGEKILIG